MNKELCEGTEDSCIGTDLNIIPRFVSEKYSDIICYGIRIEKNIYGGDGRKTVAFAELDDLFFRYDDAAAFVEYAKRNRIEPCRLREAVERFTREYIMTVGA